MRTSVTSDSVISDPPGPSRFPTLSGPASQTLRYEVTGDSAGTTPVRVRLVDVTRGMRLAADDEGRHVSDDPLAWLDGSSWTGADA